MGFADGILYTGLGLTILLLFAEPFTRGRVGLLTGLLAVIVSLQVRLALFAAGTLPGLSIFSGYLFLSSVLLLGPTLLKFSLRAGDLEQQHTSELKYHFALPILSVLVETICIVVFYDYFTAKYLAAFETGEFNILSVLIIAAACYLMAYFIYILYLFFKETNRSRIVYAPYSITVIGLLLTGVLLSLTGFLNQSELLFSWGYIAFTLDTCLAILVSMKFPEFFYRLAEQNTRYSTISINRIDVADIKKKIERVIVRDEGYRNGNLNSSTLAQRLGLHRNQLSRVINEQFGCSFKDYLNKHRLAAAKEALLTTQDTVLDIAYESGFNSLSSFNARFKTDTGMSPVEFRKKNGLK